MAYPEPASFATNPMDAARLALGRLRQSIGPLFAAASLGRAAGGAFLIRIASAAIAFLSQPLLARWMGSEEFGIYAYVWTWALLLGGIVDFGLSTAAQRFIPEYHEHGATALLRGFVRGSRLFTLVAATAVALAGAAATSLFSDKLGANVVVPMYLACAMLPFWGLTVTQDGIARSYGWIGLALLPLYVMRPLAILALIFAAYLCGYPATAVSIMLAAVAASLAAALIQGVLINRRLKAKIAACVCAYDFRTWIATSLPISIAGTFYFLLSYVDILVLQAYRPATDVAVYFAAQKLLALVAFVHFSIAATVAHRFSEMRAAGQQAQLVRFYSRARHWSLWPSLAGVAFLMAFGWPLLWLFGPEFVSGYALLAILSVGLLARAATGPAERLLNMFGRQNVCALVYLVAFACNLAGCILLVPACGPAGAAASTSAALLIESAALYALARRRLGSPQAAAEPT